MVSVQFITHVITMRTTHKYCHLLGSNANAALREWQDDPAIPILIITKKDTQGVQLHMASCLILWDIPTIDTVQKQAFGRVVRMGQQKGVWTHPPNDQRIP